MSLAVLCIDVLARFPDQLPHQPRIYPSPAILDAFLHTRDPSTWVTLAQLVHPLPPHTHDFDLEWSHPALPSLQRIKDTPDFSLVTLLSLPNCSSLRDDDIAGLRTLRRLVALDLRGCSVSSRPLSRGLVDGGPLGLRLLSLHGCPNIDDHIFTALVKLPLLSALDLRFTRCSPSALNAHLSSLGFRPSDNTSLFHPAPISLAICSLEKVARSASHPIPLYSCPPHSVFRIHIHDLPLPSRSKKVVVVDTSHSESAIRTISSAEDTIVFIPPLRKPSKVMPSIVDRSIDQPTSPHSSSNASSFYENAPSKKRILPFSAQAIQSSEGGQLDPLAVARSPPPWTILNQRASFDNLPTARSLAQALDKPLKVDRARLQKRGSDAVANLVHQPAKKRLKVESEFALENSRMAVSVKRNPFVRNIKSVFVECASDKLPSSSSSNTKPDTQLRPCRSLPSKTTGQQQITSERTSKPLKPITTLKPPILPKELLPSTPRTNSKSKTELKQARLSFS